MPGLLTAAEIASLQATVAAVLDQSLPLLRKTVAPDSYGNNVETWVAQGNVTCNVFRPTATHLQLYANLIRAQQAMMLRFLPGTDIRVGHCRIAPFAAANGDEGDLVGGLGFPISKRQCSSSKTILNYN